jgi:hypothetical protein
MSGMKPLNMAKETCSPVSSNCIIWQGPDLPCLRICKGDTITELMYQMACALCEVQKELDPRNYDLACLEIPACDVPTTFTDFVNLIIAYICNCCQNNQQVPPITDQQLVSIAACFQETLGVTNTIANYITLLGTEVCNLRSDVNILTSGLQDLALRLDELETNLI